MEPLSWGCFEINQAKLGETAKVVTTCLESNGFWEKLKSSHQTLEKKYLYNLENG